MRRHWLPVLALVVAACAGSVPRRSTGTQAASLAAPELVRLRIGDGPVSAPRADPTRAPVRVVFAFPAEFADQRVEIAIDRDGADGSWMTMRPRLRPDATLPLAGVPAGRYQVRATLVGGEVRHEARATVVVDAAAGDEVPVTMHMVTVGRAVAAPPK